MTRADPRNGCYDNSAFDGCKTLDDFHVSTNRNVSVSEAKKKTNSGCSIFQCRYIIALAGFFVYFEIDCYRIATSLSLVKMVNNTAVNLDNNANGTIDSCPLEDPDLEKLLISEAEGEFNWSPEVQSYIQSAGFLGYVICQIPGGMLASAYGAKKTLFIGLLMSSLAHVLCPFAAYSSSYLFTVMQFLRGVGQGFLPSAVSVLAAKWFPRPERGLLNSLIFEGYVIGSVITYISSGALCSSSLIGGWPLVYYVYGGFGILFSVFVHFYLYESPKEHPKIEKAELKYILENQESDLTQKPPPTPWKKILTSVPVYAVTYSVFSEFWAMTQQLSEHPLFLGNILHFSIEKNGMLNAIPFAFQIPVIFFGGWISKWLNTRGYASVNTVRKGCTLLYSLGYSMGLLGTYFAGCNRVWSNVTAIIAFSFVGLAIPGCLIVPADMSPTFAGSLSAFSNTIASSATFVFPLIVGKMISEEETLEQWKKIFLLCIAIILSSGILFCIFGSAEIQPWNFPSKENDEKKQSKDESIKSGTKECALSIEMSTHL